MNASQTTTVQANKSSSIDESKPGFRTKTISTRLTPDELAEVESLPNARASALGMAARDGVAAARERPADPMELLLAEVWAVRFALLKSLPCRRSGDGRRQARCSPNRSSKSVTEPTQRSSNRLARCSPISSASGPRRVRKSDELEARFFSFWSGSLAFATVAEALAHLGMLALVLDTHQRHYLPAYFWCSLPVVGPSTVEVRWIWKIGRHRKRQLATDDDVVDSADGIGMTLSQSALDAGWKSLIEGPPQQVPADQLRPDLADSRI